MSKRSAIIYILCISLVFVLSACGGGGDGDNFPGVLPEDVNIETGGFGPESPAPAPGGPVFDEPAYTPGGPAPTTPDSSAQVPSSPGQTPGAPPAAGGTIPAVGAGSNVGVSTPVGVAAWNREVPVRSRTVMVSSAGELTQADTEYVLTGNIVAAGTAFTIRASNVTLNLNGHTVTYANTAASGPNYGVAVLQSGLRDIAVVNGEIRQGNAASATDTARRGWHAIYFSGGVPGMKIAGLKIEYRTPETSAIMAIWGKDGAIHHNEFNDTGSTIIDRHQLIAVIKTNRDAMKIHNNRIIRARQAGIDIGKGSEVFENEINIDSHSTNSYGIVAYAVDGFTLYRNTIVGRGEHPIGIGMVSKSLNGKVHSNSINVQNTRGSAEYGATGSAGMRMTWGTDKTEVWNNHITVSAQANLIGPGLDSWGRGLWLGLPDAASNVLFRNNTILANNNDGRAKAAGIAVVCGNRSPGLVLSNNLVVSNWANVLLTDDYGDSQGFPRFVGNTFRKADNHAAYRTIRSHYVSRIATGNFISNRYENGASANSIDLEWNGSANKEAGFGWQCRIVVRNAQGQPVQGASIQITDNAGVRVFTGTTGADGRISAELMEYIATNRGSYTVTGALSKDVFGVYGNKIVKNPYSLRVEGGGKTVNSTFQITGDMELPVNL